MTDGKDELRSRFEDRTPNPDDPDSTQDTGHTDETDATTSTRERSQYPMYLSEPLQEELNKTFEQFNAQRTLDDKEQVEKHKDFLEGVVRAGLDQDWEEYVLNDV